MRKFVFIILLLFSSICYAELKVVAPAEVFQGRSFIVFVSSFNDDGSPEALKGASAKFDGKKISFYRYEDGLRAIIGTEPEKKTGDYPLNIEAIYPDGKIETKELSVTVSSRIYPKVSFWLKPAKKKLMAPTLIEDEWGQIQSKLLQESQNKLWDGYFKKPVPGITTMYFGTKEYINAKPRSRHRGQDFRAKVGTPVVAAHNGKIVVAQFFKAFGGTVVIDHGQGINTLYFHLSKIFAEAGQDIRKGEKFGLSGNTGISSGPHVHWGMSVHDVRVDPIQWVQTVIP
ncbi:MAG: M23 family metallopeptidase [Candidatus Margulisiibacteriota bacterium]